MDDDEEVELGWIRIAKVLADTDTGVDLRITYSDSLPMLDALGMMSAAAHQVWSDA